MTAVQPLAIFRLAIEYFSVIHKSTNGLGHTELSGEQGLEHKSLITGKRVPKTTVHISLLRPCFDYSTGEQFVGLSSPKGVLFLIGAEESELPVEPFTHLSFPQRESLRALVTKFAHTISDSPSRTHLLEHGIELEEGAKLLRCGNRRILYVHRLVARLEILTMLEKEIIVPSHSEFTSQVVCVKKPDGSLHLCIDYLALNHMARFDSYPVPRMEDVLEQAAGKKWLSTMDLCRGFHQILMAKDVGISV